MRTGWICTIGLLSTTCYGTILPKATLKEGDAIAVTACEVARVETVSGNPTAARLSERSARAMTTYALTQSNDTLQWTLQSYEATLPSGGYQRTLVSLTNPTSKEVALDRVYLADAVALDATKTYTLSGNTDGAVVIMTPKEGDMREWFAIEHPMAKYTLVTGTLDPMASKSTYNIDDLINKGITGPTWDGKHDNYYGSGIFWVPVEVTASELHVTLQYTNGNLKALYYSVEAFDLTKQTLLASDTHDGESGSASSKNTYTLRGLTVGAKVLLKVTCGTHANNDPSANQGWVSNGDIKLDGANHIAITESTLPPTMSAYIPVADTLRAGETITFSVVQGWCNEASQLRRTFNRYLNAERAHPHRVLPHYNSWYDLCINRNDKDVSGRFSEQEALESMRAFRSELWEKRGVFINSYLWDDGWDEWNSLWGFNANFPNGFTNLAAEAHQVKGASISCWMSPFGGYGGSFSARLAYAKKMGYVDSNASGLQLSKPTYYAAFRDRVLQMIQDYDMNLFKFDRMGSGSDATGAAEQYAADLRAVGNLCAEMRAAKQDVFINCTVGTWASPYWLMWCDSIWKGDGDCDWLGSVGTQRQKWVTYRDNIIHDRFVSKAPLFPLNSMMMHGIIVCPSSPNNTMTDYKGTGNYAYAGEKYATPTACADFAAEVWMGVALGTGLQEYYISPNLMSDTWWDILANGIKWLKQNETVLTDVHWIGGDPGDGADLKKQNQSQPKDIYGYAALGDTKGIIMLRNPSNQAQTISGTIDQWLEMPSARQGLRVNPTVVFNSTTAYENAGQSGAFSPTWPTTTAETLNWTLPPFTTFLFEVNSKPGYRLLLR